MALKGLNEAAIRKLLSIIGDENDDGLDTDDSSSDRLTNWQVLHQMKKRMKDLTTLMP